MIDQTQFWWPLATSDELHQNQPLSRMLLELPLVLFRDSSNQPIVQVDRCPHRHAPLSSGRVINGELECPYHGWRFNAKGQCTRIPGLESHRCSNNPVSQVVNSTEMCGLIWACISPQPNTPSPCLPTGNNEPHDAFFMTDVVSCGIAEAAENFLDGFHTHFVHRGWIRRDSRRQKVTARIREIAGGVEAHYSGEGLQSGLISRLLEQDRSESMGRFRLPGVAEIEYRNTLGLNLLVTAWFTPEAQDRLRIHARIATRRGILPAWIKTLVLKHLFGTILHQDKQILEQVHSNVTFFNSKSLPTFSSASYPLQLDTSLDLLSPYIRGLLNGDIPKILDIHELTMSL